MPFSPHDQHESLEVSMLNKDNFSDEELESYLKKEK